MQEDYNTTTLFVGIGMALALVAIAIIIINLPEIVHIISTEGLLSK